MCNLHLGETLLTKKWKLFKFSYLSQVPLGYNVSFIQLFMTGCLLVCVETKKTVEQRCVKHQLCGRVLGTLGVFWSYH